MSAHTSRTRSAARSGTDAAPKPATDTTTAPTVPVEEAAASPTTEISTAETIESETAGTGVEATWADAVPWLALQVGARPTAMEMAFAVPVWRLLQAAPGSTVLRLAADAETCGLVLDPATVTRILTRYQRTGIVRGETDGPVTRWSTISPAAVIADAQATATNPATAGRSRQGARPGGLREAVAEFLAERAGQAWSPNQIAKDLGNSAGAIANAVDKLVADGTAVQTSQRPRRYQHAGATTSTTEATDGDTRDGEAAETQ